MSNTRTVEDIVNARRIINGPSDKLRAVSATKYPWTRDMWKKQVANTWFVETLNLVRDANEFPLLKPGQQTAIKRGLAFLSNLDGIQVENLSTNVSVFITDPSISQLIRRQIFEEDIHVETYSAIVESLIRDPLEIYDMYRQVPLLANKNDFITNASAEVTLFPTDENKVASIAGNLILEGIYFFTGFLTFYTIGRSTGKIQGTVDGIKYIQRDEVTHLEIFKLIWLSLREERPDLFVPAMIERIRQMFYEAVRHECAWGHFLIEDGVLGLTPTIIDGYVQWLAENIAQSIGIGSLFPGVLNPVPWVIDYAKVNKTHGNFFEAIPQGYSQNKPVFSRNRTRT